MRVCYFGTYDLGYPRNSILIEGLRRNGVEVVECHVPLWQGTEDKVAAAQRVWRWPAVIARAARAYTTLVRKFRTVDDCDALILGYMGQIDAFPARLLASRRQIPLVLDVFMSISLITRERGLATPGSGVDRIVSWVENRACRLADMVWLDTPFYVEYFQQRYQLPADAFRLIPTGADGRYFYPVHDTQRDSDRPFTVSYVGKYVPLHGVPTILQAAALLREEGVRFEMIGGGDAGARAEAIALARELGAENVVFEGWVEKEELSRRLATADVCLGIFGHRKQGTITVPNKLYEGMAMRKPVITGRTPAVEAAFECGRHLLTVPLKDPQALADAILRLRDDAALRDRLAEEGYREYQAHYTPTALGAKAVCYLQEAMEQPRSR